MPPLEPGTQAPKFALSDIEGDQHELDALLARGPVLTVFYKKGCGTCQYSAPFFERFHERFKDTAASIVLVSQDDPGGMREFAKDFGVTAAIGLDEEPYKVSRAYGLMSVPTLFTIDPEGMIAQTCVGFAKADFNAMAAWLGEQVGADPSPIVIPSDDAPEFKPG
jgi:peroxiredoxin Q/BCP